MPFLGECSENPYTHLQHFELVCSPVNIPSVHKDTLRWKLFPFSLKDATKTWYIHHVEDAEGSWPSLREFFCKKFFPLSKIIELWRKLINFEQKDQEPLGVAWEILLSYTVGPDLGLPECMLLQHFIWGLKPESAKFLDIATGGAVVYTTPIEGKRIIAKILINLEDYQPTPSEDHSEDAQLADLSPCHHHTRSPNHRRGRLFSNI
ncbi:hypothetical protein PR202_gb20321 [Eleusine coracana subsp. coracana]|uniref:Retrotransposon gag domain-containing protein n=1 Tax=Eleusine coracana subsp. coracana TaxID=191504 RepID=A0AAV5FB27_ELECO|nr:hypothetical protein PR202_gb20321 [Eleusine coracana subsp. coracana]